MINFLSVFMLFIILIIGRYFYYFDKMEELYFGIFNELKGWDIYN